MRASEASFLHSCCFLLCNFDLETTTGPDILREAAGQDVNPRNGKVVWTRCKRFGEGMENKFDRRTISFDTDAKSAWLGAFGTVLIVPLASIILISLA